MAKDTLNRLKGSNVDKVAVVMEAMNMLKSVIADVDTCRSKAEEVGKNVKESVYEAAVDGYGAICPSFNLNICPRSSETRQSDCAARYCSANCVSGNILARRAYSQCSLSVVCDVSTRADSGLAARPKSLVISALQQVFTSVSRPLNAMQRFTLRLRRSLTPVERFQ
ncbi:hypothetical protein ERJ75_000180500 [Trypanosoma vivax]|nr:hypothetical protein ERJ75_000180500 [Trypanosoma vivax]